MGIRRAKSATGIACCMGERRPPIQPPPFGCQNRATNRQRPLLKLQEREKPTKTLEDASIACEGATFGEKKKLKTCPISIQIAPHGPRDSERRNRSEPAALSCNKTGFPKMRLWPQRSQQALTRFDAHCRAGGVGLFVWILGRF